MAGSFYTLEEVAQILGKSEDEVRNLVQEGKIREFRDGSKRLFKKEEIDGLKIELEPLILSDSGELDFDLDDKDEAPLGLSDESSMIGLADESSVIGLAGDTKADEKPADEDKSEKLGSMDDMIELSEADTQLGDEGLNLLADEGDELNLEDELSDTEIDLAGSEPSEDIGRLDADANMDSFGSGSGLLDLSLQADDTSLGAVLDDILPSAGGDEAGGAAIDELDMGEGMGEPLFDEGLEEKTEEAPVEEIAEEAPLADDFGGMEEPEAEPAAPAAAVAYIEVEEDPTSNAFGSMLFIPLLSLVFVAVVVMAATKGITTSLLLMTQNIIWMIAGGMFAVALIVLGIGYVMTNKGSKKK